jgi:hypothetical protein
VFGRFSVVRAAQEAGVGAAFWPKAEETSRNKISTEPAKQFIDASEQHGY